MQSALIITSGERSGTVLAELLAAEKCSDCIIVSTSEETKEQLKKRSFDLFVINTPLAARDGFQLAVYLSERLSGEIILIVSEESAKHTCESASEHGIITLTKPLNASAFRTAFLLARAMRNRWAMLHKENIKLQQKIDDIRIVDRAKSILVSRMGMSEPEAHRYLEKQAMDRRITRREVANSIIKTYEY